MQDIEILHFMPDEKFISNAISYFNRVAGSRNLYFVKVSGDKVLNNLGTNQFTDFNIALLSSIIEDHRHIKAVIFHSIFNSYTAKALKSSLGVKVFWFSWGADFYSYLRGSFFTLYGPLTRRALVINYWHYLKMSVSTYLFRDIKEFKSFTKTVDFISTVIEADYRILKDNFPWIIAKYVPFSYASVEDIFGMENTFDYSPGNKILIGNSSTASNNHLEIFKIFSRIEFGNSEIIVPLSYGNTRYASVIADSARKILGNNFNPLLGFLSQSDYINLMKSCGVIIFNHYRQQAMGNIIMGLSMGIKLFLSSRSPVWDFLTKELGAIVFSTEKIPFEKMKFTNDLTDEQKLHNRNAILSYYNKNLVHKRVEDIVNLVSN